MAHRSSRPLRPRLDLLEGRLVLSGTTTVPSILYVNSNASATSTGTSTSTSTSTSTPEGSSWATAYTSLQDALTAAATANRPEQIWIAQGTYTPSLAPSGSTAANLKTFAIPDNVTLLGGFVAGATSAADRSPKLHPTILSGDLDGNDLADPTATGFAASIADNADHVVTIGGGTTTTATRVRLSGLTITGGNATATATSTDDATSGAGGGVLIGAGSTVRIDHCQFTANSATGQGGAIAASGARLAITDSSFTGNTAGTFGGAVAAEGGTTAADGSSLEVAGTTFQSNQAAEGGAVLVDSLPALVDETRFLSNTATVGGGALATSNLLGTTQGTTTDRTTTVTHSSFVGNIAQGSTTAQSTLDAATGATGLNFALGGGAITNGVNGQLVVDADVFRANSATAGDGGAILTGDSSVNSGTTTGSAARTRIVGSDFLANTAPAGQGGALAATTDGLTANPPNTTTTLTVLGSNFADNTGSTTSGYNLVLANASATISGNRTTATATNRGQGIAATASRVNGKARTTTATTTTTTPTDGTTVTDGTTTTA